MKEKRVSGSVGQLCSAFIFLGKQTRLCLVRLPAAALLPSRPVKCLTKSADNSRSRCVRLRLFKYFPHLCFSEATWGGGASLSLSGLPGSSSIFTSPALSRRNICCGFICGGGRLVLSAAPSLPLISIPLPRTEHTVESEDCSVVGWG